MKKKFTFLLSLVSLAIFSLPSCKIFLRESSLKTTSDRLKEYRYRLDGTMEIPTDHNLLLLAHLVDLLRREADHPDDEGERARIDALLQDRTSLQKDFAEAYREGFPILDESGKVIEPRIKYWLARQIKMATTQLSTKEITLTFDKSQKDIKIKTEVLDGKIKVDYSAFFFGTTPSDYHGSEVPRLVEGETLLVPRNPIQVYFDTISPSMPDTFNRAILALKTSSSLDDVADEIRTHLSVTKNLGGMLETNCSFTDGDAISPFNYFYYFDPLSPQCPADTITAKITAIEEQTVATTYPEYHRLFADNKLEFFIYYNQVGDEGPFSARRLAALLLQKEYRLDKFDLAWIGEGPGRTPTEGDIESYQFNIHYARFIKNIEGIDFMVELAVNDGQEGADKMLKDAISGKEIVVYDGHAGYGVNIDSNFTISDSYPKDTYQIFFLNGCSTYKYGMSEILTAKAFRDFDFDNLNVDVITSSSSISGHTQQNRFLNSLEVSASFYDKPSEQWTVRAKESLSWLGIITEVNQINDMEGNSNSFFMVSGEQRNNYLPGKKDFVKPNLQPIDLERIITSQEYEISLRFKALKLYLEKVISESDAIEIMQGKAQRICLEIFKDFKVQQDFLQYFYPSCNLRYIYATVPKNVLINGLEFDLHKTLTFYENGQVGAGQLTKEYLAEFGEFGKIKIGFPHEFEDYYRTIFRDDGQVLTAIIAEPIKVKLGLTDVQIPEYSIVEVDPQYLKVSSIVPTGEINFSAKPGLDCKFGKMESISLYLGSNMVSFCKLAKDQDIDGIPAIGEREVSLDPDGIAISLILAKDFSFKIDKRYFGIDEMLAKAHEKVSFNKEHFLSAGVFAKSTDITMQGKTYRVPAGTTFDHSWSNVFQISPPGESKMSFLMTLPHGYNCYAGRIFPNENDETYFFDSGFYFPAIFPTICQLSETTEIKELGKTAEKGSILYLDEKGIPTAIGSH